MPHLHAFTKELSGDTKSIFHGNVDFVTMDTNDRGLLMSNRYCEMIWHEVMTGQQREFIAGKRPLRLHAKKYVHRNPLSWELDESQISLSWPLPVIWNMPQGWNGSYYCHIMKRQTSQKTVFIRIHIHRLHGSYGLGKMREWTSNYIWNRNSQWASKCLKGELWQFRYSAKAVICLNHGTMSLFIHNENKAHIQHSLLILSRKLEEMNV